MNRLLVLTAVALLVFLLIAVQCTRDVLGYPLSFQGAARGLAIEDASPLAAMAMNTANSAANSAANSPANSLDDSLDDSPEILVVQSTAAAFVGVPFPTSGSAAPSPVAKPVNPTRYTVRNGDYFSKIAKQFGVSYSALVAANPRINPNLLIAGQVLTIPRVAGSNPNVATADPNKAGPSRLALGNPSPTPAAHAVPAKPSASPTAAPTRVPALVPNPAPIASAPKRYVAPPAWILGPSQGSGEDDKHITELIWHLDEHRIPITAFHFDSDRWQTCANNAEWKWSDSLLQRMRSHNPPIRGLFWILPLIEKRCSEYGAAASQGFFVRNSDGSPMVTSSWQGTGSWIDFNNPQAVAYWHSLLDRIFNRAQGVIGGFYTDDLHPNLDSAYSNAFVRDLYDYTRSKVPDGDVVLKSYGVGTPDNTFMSRYGHASYVNDLESNFAGMREGIRRVFAVSAFLPAPFNEFTGYAMRVPDTETYIRRLHWGAFQPIMENDSLPKNGVPWDPQYTPQVLQTYQYYATLHWELVPYFHTYDQLAYQNNGRIFQQANAARFSTVLGREIFVQYVTDNMRSIDVTLPAGQWINYWNEQEVHTGPKTFSYPVPLGREAIFVANGAIIPMQVRDSATGHGTTASAGALTVNVFPDGHSTFSYYDVAKRWVVFDVRQTGNQLRLCTSAPPSQPLIYRVVRRSSAPRQVTTLQGAVGVDTNWGTPLPQLGSETAVDGSGGGWFYDAGRQLLIIKLSQVGSSCP